MGKAYATLRKVNMDNGGFYGCLIEPQGVSVCWKEKAQTRAFLLPTFVETAVCGDQNVS